MANVLRSPEPSAMWCNEGFCPLATNRTQITHGN